MKKFYIIFFLFIFALSGWLACSKPGMNPTTEPAPAPAQKTDEVKISHYTCTMHPRVHEDKPGLCPFCHMDLVPVYLDSAGDGGAGDGVSTTISTHRQQLVGIETMPVVRKNIVKDIRTVGRVAFDPDLAIAQQEYVEISKNIPALKATARSRLTLLGMTEPEISALDHNKKTFTELYLPQAGESVWVYATLFTAEMELIKPGQTANIFLTTDSEKKFIGTVRGLDPVVDPVTRSVRARIEIPKAGGLLKPDTYVTVVLQVDFGSQLTIPKSALLSTGVRRLAFVKMPDNQFQTRELKTGVETAEDVMIVSGLTEGENVVTQSAFFVDAETQLKAASQQELPSCPKGQTWDVGMAMCMPATP